jgi:hypothetical protein
LFAALLNFFETVEDGTVHSCFKKRSRLAKGNTSAFPGGSLISASLGYTTLTLYGFRKVVFRKPNPLEQSTLRILTLKIYDTLASALNRANK